MHADRARKAQLGPLVLDKEQANYLLACAITVGEADDHELLAMLALELEPGFAPIRV